MLWINYKSLEICLCIKENNLFGRMCTGKIRRVSIPDGFYSLYWCEWRVIKVEILGNYEYWALFTGKLNKIKKQLQKVSKAFQFNVFFFLFIKVWSVTSNNHLVVYTVEVNVFICAGRSTANLKYLMGDTNGIPIN